MAFSIVEPTFVATAAQNPDRIVAPPAYDWPMFLRSANHTGVVTSPAPLSNHIVRFVNVSTSGPVRSSPVLFNDILFLGSGGVFHSLNASTMTYNATISQGWNYTIGAGFSFDSSPAVGGGSVFIGATDGKLYAFEASITTCSKLHPGCHLKWSFNTGGPILSSPAYSDGMVFVGSDDGKVYCVNANTGGLVWKSGTNGKVRSSPAVANSEVMVGSDDGRVYFLDESTGAKVQRYVTNGPVESSPAVSGGIAYFGSNDSMIYAVNASTGKTVWKFLTGGPVVASPAVADGRVYVGSMDGYFYALKAQHNKNQLFWSTSIGSVAGSAALANGVIVNLSPTFLPMAYVTSTNGRLSALVRSTGAVNWTLSVSQNTISSPVVAYTKIYLDDNQGNLTELGGIRGGTAGASFGSSGPDKKFHRGDFVLIGANTAWGKFGINESLVTIKDPLGNILVDNATTQFITGISAYNFQYTFTLSSVAATGKYKVTFFVEDANPKTDSNNPRCCGWIVVTTTFKVTLS